MPAKAPSTLWAYSWAYLPDSACMTTTSTKRSKPVQTVRKKMIVESIQRVFSATPLATEQQIYKQVLDEASHKKYTEVYHFIVYNRVGQIETSHEPKIDQRA